MRILAPGQRASHRALGKCWVIMAAAMWNPLPPLSFALKLLSWVIKVKHCDFYQIKSEGYKTTSLGPLGYTPSQLAGDPDQPQNLLSVSSFDPICRLSGLLTSQGTVGFAGPAFLAQGAGGSSPGHGRAVGAWLRQGWRRG